MRQRARRALSILAGVALALAATGLSVRLLTPEGVSAVALPRPRPSSGGWSGIDVSADGSRFWILSDGGAIAAGRLLRAGDGSAGGGIGRLVAAEIDRPVRLFGRDGRPGPAVERDSEGLARLDDGSFAVSFERDQRVALVPDPAAPEQTLPAAEGFGRLGPNRGLEALAVDPEGRLVTLPELPPAGARDFPVWRLDVGGWQQPFALARSGPWAAVGADFGPDGRFYLLERRFFGMGFATRIRRFDLDAPGAVKAGEVLYRSPPGRHGNLEGIGIWADPTGGLHAVMVSDNNFLRIQRSQIVELALPG